MPDVQTPTTVTVFDPDMTAEALRDGDTRTLLSLVGDLFREWARNVGEPNEWARWISDPNQDGAWADNDTRQWTRDYGRFLDWLRLPANRSRIPGAVPPTVTGYTVPATADFDVETLRTHEDAWLAYRRGTGTSERTIERDWTSLTRRHPGEHYSFHIDAFRTWLGQHPEHHPAPPAPPVAPIGPDTPGWTEWWSELWEYADDEGYEEQYNALARALGGPLRDSDDTDPDDEEQDYVIDVVVESFTVSVSARATANQLRDDAGSYYDQSDVDQAIRDHIESVNVEYRTEDWYQN